VFMLSGVINTMSYSVCKVGEMSNLKTKKRGLCLTVNFEA